jgi:hypothetical protein
MHLLNCGLGFFGLVKGDASDFIVREVRDGGIISDLTTTELPPLPTIIKSIIPIEQPKLDEGKDDEEEVEEEELTSFETLESMSEFESFTKFMDNEIGAEWWKVGESEKIFAFSTSHLTLKEDRKQLAKSITDMYPFVKLENVSLKDTVNVLDAKGENKIGTECRVKVNEQYAQLYSLFAPADFDLLMRFLNNRSYNEDVGGGKQFLILPTSVNDKNQRTKMHLEIGKYFKFVNTSTEGSNRIKVMLKKNKKRKMKMRDDSGNCGKRLKAEESLFTSFILRKEGMEHLGALYKMASCLNIPISRFSFSGIKDKVAITYQHMRVSDVSAEKLLGSLKQLQPRIQVGNFTYKSSPLFLGDHDGNHFELRYIVIYVFMEFTSTKTLFLKVDEFRFWSA